jgi:hypothetical protein
MRVVSEESFQVAFRRALAAHRRAIELHEKAALFYERAGLSDMAETERARVAVERERLNRAEHLHADWA